MQNISAPQDVLGSVIAVHGSQVLVGLFAAPMLGPQEQRVTVGKFLGLHSGLSLLIGVVTDVSLRTEPVSKNQDYITVATLELIGEINEKNAAAGFRRGVSEYPAIGDSITSITARELRLIFNVSGSAVIDIGSLQQDSSIGAYVNVNDMLSKHFAVLGTTGVGKSSGVAMLLQQVLAARPDLRVLILDVHNEYRGCFGQNAQTLSPRNLKLPFWLFNFEEIVDIFFGTLPGFEEEIDLLSELIPAAKSIYTQVISTPNRLKRPDAGNIRYTVDIPMPYRIADLLALLDERMGKLENRSSRLIYHKLMARIETVSNDPRYAFMFENANVGGDTMADVLGHVFRYPIDGKPMTIMQLAGFPSEVVDALVSTLCRMAFDLGLWSNGANPLLLVCEEAHRYMSADHSIGFGPTRRAISRIAKEGRKHGVFLGLITQRPAELDPTILSQCSTMFVMRMTNDRDQALLRSAVSDSAANLLSFLPSLGTGEVFAFGEGFALPTRLRFRELPAGMWPKSEATISEEPIDPLDESEKSLAAIISRWRGVASRQKPAVARMTEDLRSVVESAVTPSLRRMPTNLQM